LLTTSFARKTVGGLPVWGRRILSVTRIGPATLAVGTKRRGGRTRQVRLGMKPDLKLRAFRRFQALDRQSAIGCLAHARRPAAGFSSDIPSNYSIHRDYSRPLADVAKSDARPFAFEIATPEQAARSWRATSTTNRSVGCECRSDLLLYAQPPEIINGMPISKSVSCSENGAGLSATDPSIDARGCGHRHL
jgi:hypothetical protein